MANQSKAATVIDAGEGVKLNILGHAVTVREDEYIYIAEGTYEVFLNGRTQEAKADARLHFPPMLVASSLLR